MQPKLRQTKRIKEKYNAVPNARERAYHLWLIDTFPCICGCGAPSGVVHHPLTRHPAQRWRRDHEFVVPMDGHCHMALHQAGSEPPHLADLAYWHRSNALELGKL